MRTIDAHTAGYGAQNAAAALVSSELKVFRFKKTDLDISAVVLPGISEPGRFRTNVNASYYLKFFGELRWNLSFYGNWDNQPPPTLAGSDYGTSSGLSWTFRKSIAGPPSRPSWHPFHFTDYEIRSKAADSSSFESPLPIVCWRH